MDLNEKRPHTIFVFFSNETINIENCDLHEVLFCVGDFDVRRQRKYIRTNDSYHHFEKEKKIVKYFCYLVMLMFCVVKKTLFFSYFVF